MTRLRDGQRVNQNEREMNRLRKTMSLRENFNALYVWHNRRLCSQAVQQGCPRRAWLVGLI